MKIVSAVLLSCCLFAASIDAAPKKSQKSKEELSRGKAAELFSQSKAYYNIHEYQKAMEGFKEAYILAQEPVLLLNIGQCYRYLGQYQDAIVSYQTFLQEDPTTPYAANVESLIKEMQQKLSELKAPEPVALPTIKAEPKQLPPAMLSDEPYRTPSILYGATAAAFVLGAGAGGLAIALTRKEADIQSDIDTGDSPASALDDLQETQQQQKSALGAMIGLGVVSVATATTGVLLFRHHKKNQREKEIVPIEAIFNEPGLVAN